MNTWTRRLIFTVIALLYVISIPWYRKPGAYPELWFGFPDWVAVATLCYVGVALLNSLAWFLRSREESDEPVAAHLRVASGPGGAAQAGAGHSGGAGTSAGTALPPDADGSAATDLATGPAAADSAASAEGPQGGEPGAHQGRPGGKRSRRERKQRKRFTVRKGERS